MTFDKKKFMNDANKEIQAKLEQELWRLGDKVLMQTMNMLDSVNKTSDTGALAGSGKVTKSEGQVMISYMSPYAADIEYGTDPHYVNPLDLKPWVRRKLGTPAKEVNKVASIISRKILNYGTNPQPFMRPILNHYVNNGILEYKITGKGEYTRRNEW